MTKAISIRIGAYLQWPDKSLAACLPLEQCSGSTYEAAAIPMEELRVRGLGSLSGVEHELSEMDDDTERDLRRLAKRYGIVSQPPMEPNDWPAAHRDHFSNIQKIGEYRFDSYSTTVDIRSDEQPWRQGVKVKTRAGWLASRAASLFNQQRNESGWRFGLENDIFRRFRVEVAW